jgi:hypothetical protein
VTQLRVIERPDNDTSPIFHDDVWPSWWKNPETWGLMWRTPEYDLPDRESWLIVLPNGAGIWNTTEHSSLKEKPMGNQAGPLWGVTGTPPGISVTPSIDAGLYGWHGFITNGIMTP